ncbi:MAG: asparagine synthase (glutamine-hydrolyzing) [Thermaerobacter sp.]|nr:asparagine synthase (glutamine-hydrolyzing) [Thermaerobacter sp.]
MCGIAGWVDWTRDLSREEATLATMSAPLTCRGPDGEGIWMSPQAALAHRRLVVIDPEGGAQPMVRHHAGRSCVISYNGELYNTPELRRELAARGQRFATLSDTEVLLAAFMQWGEACLERLNGIFAFAVWDTATQRLLLARDRLGVKPLFYARRKDALLFGSELKALLAHPAVSPELDASGLAEVLAVGPARTPGHGIFRQVAELEPGCCLTYEREGLRRHRYWSLQSKPHSDDLPTTLRRVRELLEDAVTRQLVSDVPVATLLSGGLDSSAVTAMAATEFARRGRILPTFSVDFLGMEQDFRPNRFQTNLDAPWAQRVADLLGTRHRAVVLDTPELVAHLTTALHARDLPGMADVDTSLYLFSQEVKRTATVALSGEAADEIFGGYPWFHLPEALAADTFPWARRVSDRVRLLSPDLVAHIRPESYVRDRYRAALEEVPRLPGEDPGLARIREVAYLSVTRFLPTLLERKDRMSMAAGLEVRVPFCDHRLVEYAWNVPWDLKCAGAQPKGILRQALEGLLPPDVRSRRKSPYPSTHNPAYLTAMRERFLEIAADPASPLVPLLHPDAVRDLTRTPAHEELPWFGQLMGTAQLFAYLIQIDTWLRDYRVVIC